MEREGHWQLRAGNRARFFELPSTIFAFNILYVTEGWEAEGPRGRGRTQRCQERILRGVWTLLEWRRTFCRVDSVSSQGQCGGLLGHSGGLLGHSRVSPIVFAQKAGMISCCGPSSPPSLGGSW